jgi:spectinomycin phosphotransferase
VVAPLPTRSGALWVPFGAFNLILYPFIEARTGMDAGLTRPQWTELGRALRKLHALDPPPHIRSSVLRESFDAPYWVAEMRRLQVRIDGAAWRDAIDAELAAFWTHRRDQMYRLMTRTLALGRELLAVPREFVLCHSDIHTANVLVESKGALHIVDWDQPVFAPKERDLMFFGAGLGSLTGDADDASHFYEGYGPTAIDRAAFAYYRYAWVMQDWVACGAEVLLYDELGEVTRRNSLRSFVAMFAPGNVVDVAYTSDDRRGAT